MDMDEFTRGYVGCALWLSDENPRPGSWDHNVDKWIKKLDAKSLAAMERDCADFQAANVDTLSHAYVTGYTAARAGHDFWLTRNHHGAGFWDRDLGELGDVLTTAAHACGERDLYFAGRKIYQMGSE